MIRPQGAASVCAFDKAKVWLLLLIACFGDWAVGHAALVGDGLERHTRSNADAAAVNIAPGAGGNRAVKRVAEPGP